MPVRYPHAARSRITPSVGMERRPCNGVRGSSLSRAVRRYSAWSVQFSFPDAGQRARVFRRLGRPTRDDHATRNRLRHGAAQMIRKAGRYLAYGLLYAWRGMLLAKDWFTGKKN